MLSILMIEDDEAIIETIREQIDEHMPGAKFYQYTRFSEGCEAIAEIRPDIVISDWFEGEPQNPTPEGQRVWDILWLHWFCPIVFYSVYAEELETSDEIRSQHPFVRRVQKGGGSQVLVRAAVLEFVPHADAIRSVMQELDAARNATVRDVAEAIFDSSHADAEKPKVFSRAMRRRVAAALDDAQLCGTDQMLPWEQFLFPPISDHAMTGDLIRETARSADNPKAYRIILTPTCDLVRRADGHCTASRVLVAKCEAPKRFLRAGARAYDEITDEQLRNAVSAALNDPQRAGLVVLPECPTVSPLMIADLKKLELIAEAEIGNRADEGKPFTRVASIDSPFREFFVTWSQLQISCRPGVPPRNMSETVEQFAQIWSNRTTGTTNTDE